MSTIALSSPSVNLTFQGGHVGCSFKGFDRVRLPIGKKRGVVQGFTSAARRRLMIMFSKLDWRPGTLAVFMTLTYPAEFPSPSQAKKHLRAFMERFRRAFPDSSAIWRLEFQERGAPHFHVIWFNLPYIPKTTVQDMWGEVVDYEKPFTRIEAIRSRRRLMAYVGKYVAKKYAPDGTTAASDASGGFNLYAYLHGDDFVHPQTGEMCGSIGRWWGVHNREKLPLAVAVAVQVVELQAVYRFRRGARRSWPGVAKRRHQGFSLFVDGALRWFDYWQFCLRP